MSAIRNIVVVGRDAELWLTALALQRALTATGVRTQVVELPSALLEHDCYSAAPSLSGLHDLLGIDRKDVFRASRGLPASGQRFGGWGASPFTYGYDAKRAAIANVDIAQYWAKARRQGSSLPLDQLSVAAVAASLGRVGPDGQSPDEFGTIHRGYHLDAVAYSRALRSLGAERGIETRRADTLTIDRAGDRIVRIQTEDSAEITGDLFVDASGAKAVLASEHAADDWTSWADQLPVTRIFSTSAPPLSQPPAFSDIRATEFGWVGLFPLAHRTAILAALGSNPTGQEAVMRLLAAAVGTNRIAPPTVRDLHPGMRTAWKGNVVAIGAAAVALPPLDMMQLHLTHVGITNLVALFPSDDLIMPEAVTYNEVVARYAGNVRDVMAVHYRLNGRAGQSYWDDARAAACSPNLEARLSLFAARGLLPYFNEDTFDEGLWLNLLIGHGLTPRTYDPKVDQLPRDELAAGLQRLIDVVEGKAHEMPTITQYLAR